jgi:lipoprotein NlpI
MRIGVVLLLSCLACESGPVRAMRGARHYASGTEALDRGDARRAIAELELAAALVPHGSEIQNHLGLAYWAAGDLERADRAFADALELDCDNRAARMNRDRLEAGLSFEISADRRASPDEDLHVE